MKSVIKRRKFIGLLGLVGSLSTIHPHSLFSAGRRAAGLMKCKPYLQGVTTDSAIVRWITTSPAHSWVEYGEDPASMNEKARQIKDGMVQVHNTVHAIKLNGLRPGRTYYYRVVSQTVTNFKRKEIAFGEAEASAVHSFATIPQKIEDVEFVVFNDVHERPETFPHLMPFAGEGKKDFVVLNGDMYNSLRNEEHLISHLLTPLSDLFATHTPFFLVRGNHETAGDIASKITDYFDGKENTFYYSIHHGPVSVIILDSGETKSDQDPKNGGIIAFDSYREAQARWLKKEIQKEEFKRAKFKVVFIHIPPNLYTSKELHASAHYQEHWGPILEDAKIDLMICGHTHKHGVHPAVPGKHSYPIVIGGGRRDGTRTVMNIKVNDRSLKLRMMDDSGNVVGQLDL